MATNELKQTLKRLRLSGLLATLGDRIAYAKGVKLSYLEFLELILQDEIQRREQNSLNKRMKYASLDSNQTLERFDWDAKVSVDRTHSKSFSVWSLLTGVRMLFFVDQ